VEKLKWYKNPEMIVALSALFIGLVTAFTSIYSAYIDREYARASVWPRLEIFRSFNGGSFSYGITNNGTGPAIIKYTAVQDGSKYIKMWREIKFFKRIVQSHISGRTLSPNSRITPVLYEGEDAQSLANADRSISIEICYCSIYEECWVIDKNNRPVNVEACIIDDDKKFLQ